VPSVEAAWSPGSRRPRAAAVQRRNAGLARVTRLTKALAIGVVAAVVAVSAFVARAIPGGHTAPSSRSAPATTPTTAPATSPTTSGGGSQSPATTSGGGSQSPATTSGGSLSPPTTAPQRSTSPPHAVTSPTPP
jgi:hypothetical protein